MLSRIVSHEKQCAKCQRILPLTAKHWKIRKDHPKRSPFRYCRPCERDYNKRWANKRHWQHKQNAVNAYGGKCSCCSETELAFLTFDHMNGGGNAHRRESSVMRKNPGQWLERNGYPLGYRVLCFNCHNAISHGFPCPHIQSRIYF